MAEEYETFMRHWFIDIWNKDFMKMYSKTDVLTLNLQ